MIPATVTRRALAVLGFCAAVTMAAPAEAVVRYDLADPTFAAAPGYGPGSSGWYPGFTAPGFGFGFTVSDAAVARGSINVAGTGGLFITGDAADLIDLNVAGDQRVPSPGFRGNFALTAVFAPDQSVTDFRLNYFGTLAFASARGTSDAVTGAYAYEGPGCYQPGSFAPACSVTGRLQIAGAPSTAVPEPASLALLGFGLLGLAAARRRG